MGTTYERTAYGGFGLESGLKAELRNNLAANSGKNKPKINKKDMSNLSMFEDESIYNDDPIE